MRNLKTWKLSDYRRWTGPIVAVIALGLVTLLIIATLWSRERPTHAMLEKYAENPLRVGDHYSLMVQALGEPPSPPASSANSDQEIYTYPSQQPIRDEVVIRLNQQLRIVEISFPLPAAANIKMDYIANLFSLQSTTELWHQELPSTKIRLYHEDNIGLVYNESTGTIYQIYQFTPTQIANFSTHHPEFGPDDPDEGGAPHVGEEWSPDFFNNTDEIPNLITPPAATAAATP